MSAPADSSASAAAAPGYVPAHSPPAPAVTSATHASDAELREAAAHFLPPAIVSRLRFWRADGGVNNKCFFARADLPVEGESAATAEQVKPETEWLIRIYNNGNNHPRVAYEHAVLRALGAARSASTPFSFQLPVPLPLLSDPTQSMVVLQSGTSACVFPRIPGVAADSSPQVAQAIGAATAELVQAMSTLRIDLPLPNPLYRHMYDAHHAVTRESFDELMRGPRCDHVRTAADGLLAELELSEELIKRIGAMQPPLPQQQIHADLHTANVLMDMGSGDASSNKQQPRVTGVLDFEFSAPDWRVMEIAVGLSKYIATPGASACIASYVAGYRAAGGRLTAVECSLVASLIILRVLNNVIYFAGRALAGEDDLLALTTRADMYLQRCKWIREHEEEIHQCVKQLAEE